MDKRPKRRKDKYNPYTLYTKAGRYYISFVDVNNNFQEIAVSQKVFESFNRFELEDISQLNEYDRHLEHSELNENTLYQKSVSSEQPLEEYFDKAQDWLIYMPMKAYREHHLKSVTNSNGLSISAIDKQIADLSTQNLMIARLRTKSILSESEFSKQALEINSKISKLRSKRKLLLNDDSAEETISNLKHLSEIIDNFDYRDGSNEEMFSDTVEQIKAGYENKLVFTLSGGLELTDIIK